ncbi:MAG TPA: DUF3800 domain-containing protein [Stellaceae bacterium]|nr:DUF3800 domain-containing protein [Stellaceae bacterium]
MRQIFFDIAGISNPKHEPIVVCAGVITHPDKQWKLLREYLLGMVDEYVPVEHRAGFAFHATELFSGGKVFPRDKFDREWRWRVLDELVSIPEKFDLPIVWGRTPREMVEPGGYLAPTTPLLVTPPRVVHAQMISFTVACAAAEYWMNQVAEPDEIAQMIMENDDQSRAFIRYVQRYLSDPFFNSRFSEQYRVFRLSRIMYPIQFEEKTDSSALQVADVCAFVLKRWCMNKPEIDRFYKPIEPFLVNSLKTDAISASSSEGQSA